MPSFKVNFSGVTVLQGVEFSIFPIDFEWALQQCSATALPVIYEKIAGGRGSALDPAEGAHDAPQTPKSDARRLAPVALAPMIRACGARPGLRCPNYGHVSPKVNCLVIL